MSYRILFTALGIGGAAALGAFGYRTWGDPAKQAAQANTRALTELAAPSSASRLAGGPAATDDVARMRSEVARLRSEVYGLHAATLANQKQEPSIAEDPQAVKEGHARADAQWRDHMLLVAAAFERERTDERWASDMRSSVEDALARTPGLAPLAGQIECRSVSCRFDLAEDEAGVSAKQLPLFLSAIGPSLATSEAAHTVTAQGSHYTLYLSDSRRKTPAADGAAK